MPKEGRGLLCSALLCSGPGSGTAGKSPGGEQQERQLHIFFLTLMLEIIPA